MTPNTYNAAVPCSWVDLDWRGRTVRVEYQWLSGASEDAPVIVFLHEGLGSVAMWKDFPRQVCAATGLRGLVYSRPGYGGSSPRAADEVWQPDFMHRQALEVLPALRSALGLTAPVWLLGHSDGASIALLHAAHYPQATLGLVVMAPHVMVEDLSVRSIAQVAQAYAHGDLRHKLSRFHADVDSAFGGWAGAWLAPAFRDWDIRLELAGLESPCLAIQGEDDQYGSMEQIRAITRISLGVKLLELPACGHSPHRDQAAQVIASIQQFIQTTRRQA